MSRSVIAKRDIETLSDDGQNFIGVWLDENSERTDDTIYVDFKQNLECSFDCLKTYKKAWDCIAYLNSVEDGKILLILSHKHAINVMTIIEDASLSQIHLIYNFCPNESGKESWNYQSNRKLRGSYSCKDKLIQQLKDDISVINTKTETPQSSLATPSTQDNTTDCERYAVHPISVFNKPKNNSIRHLNKDSIWFIQYQLLFEILIKLEKSATDADEMIYVCKNIYKHDEKNREQIKEFAKDVQNAFKSIYWYTKPSFIVHLLNKICGSENIEEIYPFRLFIRNLHYELVELDAYRREKKLEVTTPVFRGKYLARSTFEKLKNNKNGLIEMNGFLSTTKKYRVADFYAGEGASKSDHIAVLFKLNVDPKIVNKPYAEIPRERHAIGPFEEECLFSIGSVWKIIDVIELKSDTKLASKMWCVELTLSNEEDDQSKGLAACLKTATGEKYSIGALGDFLTDMGRYEQAENFYLLSERALPETEVDRATIYNRIAYVRYERKDYNTALSYLEKAMKYVTKDSEIEVVTEYNQEIVTAEASLAVLCVPVLRRRLDYENVITKYLLSNPVSVSIIKNNFGLVRHRQGDFSGAIKFYDAALKVLLRSELILHKEISAIYNNIGGVQYSDGNYHDAQGNFRLAMTTLSKLGSDNPWIQEYTENYKAAQRHIDCNKPKRLRAE